MSDRLTLFVDNDISDRLNSGGGAYTQMTIDYQTFSSEHIENT